MDVYKELGVRHVINAMGNATVVGGSILSKEVIDAMVEANSRFVFMDELLKQAGKAVAELTGAEAAHITPGTAAALILSTSACIAGTDPEKVERLPDTEGMKDEIIIQRCLRVKYDRCMTIPGGKLVEVGDESGCRPELIEEAIGEKTAAIHYLAPGRSGAVPLEEVIMIGKKHGIPVIVDAAGQVNPPENLKKYAAMGADLICYGGKYFWAPNSTGFVIGRKDLIEAVALHSFIGFETSPYRSIGRGYKLDRQEVVATVVALRRWIEGGYRERLEAGDKRARDLAKALSDIPRTIVTTLPEGAELATRVKLTLEGKTDKEVATIARALKDGDPSIWIRQDKNALIIYTPTLVDGDEDIIVQRLKKALQ